MLTLFISQKYCPAIERELENIINRTEIRKYVENNQELFDNLTKITGYNVHDIETAMDLYDMLWIETEHGYYWNKEEEHHIIEQLSEANTLGFHFWGTPVIQHLGAGGLVKELIKNFKAVLNNENKKKLYVYSTHDTLLALLMHSLNIYNESPPPFGAALLFELHEKMDSQTKKGNYFVRVFYHNETVINSGTPHSMQLKNCQNLFDCPIDQFFNSTKHLLYENFDKECHKLSEY